MSVIANTTVVSNFAVIEQLDILRQLYKTIHISVEVYEEIQTGLEEGYAFYTAVEQQIYPVVKSGWIKLVSMTDEQELNLFSQLPSRLHLGEASSLAIAYHRDWLFMTDDRAARNQAKRLGIRLSGSVGNLVSAVEHQICTLEQANDWLNQMIEQDYKSPVNDLSSLI